MALRRTKSDKFESKVRGKAEKVAPWVGTAAALAGYSPANLLGVKDKIYGYTGREWDAAGTAGWIAGSSIGGIANNLVEGTAVRGVAKASKYGYKGARKLFGHRPGFRRWERAQFKESRPLKSHLRSLKADPKKYFKGQIADNPKKAAALGIGALGAAGYLAYKKLRPSKKSSRRSSSKRHTSKRTSKRSKSRRTRSRRSKSSKRSK